MSPSPLKAVEVHGKSMWPYLQSGDRVICKFTPEDKLIPGQIYFIEYESKFLVHRCVTPKLTKGDANNYPDQVSFGKPLRYLAVIQKNHILHRLIAKTSRYADRRRSPIIYHSMKQATKALGYVLRYIDKI